MPKLTMDVLNGIAQFQEAQEAQETKAEEEKEAVGYLLMFFSVIANLCS